MPGILPYRGAFWQSTAARRSGCDTMRVFSRSRSNGTNQMGLTSAQCKRLRAEGHRLKLKPVVIIGQKGFSDNLHNEIDTALTRHELIKMRIPAVDKSAKRELSLNICSQHNAQLVQSIGNVIVLYRCNPDIDRFAALLGLAQPAD